MDASGIVVIALLVVAILVIAFLYRSGGIKAGFEALGIKLNLKGVARPESEPPKPAAPTQAGAGERSNHVGGDAQGVFVTGDDNRVAQVQGNRNRVDQTGKG